MSSETQAKPVNRLEHFHITFFAIVMGMSGLTLAVRAAEYAAGVVNHASLALAGVSGALFVLLAFIYGLKAVRYPAAIKAEWHHPVKISFFPAVSISLLLLAIIALPIWEGAAALLWWAGMVLHGALTLAVMSSWIGTRAFQHGHLTPAWFIPAVGNVLVPIAGMQLGHADISWLFFSAGLVFWVVLLTLVMNRLVFHDPLPGRLQPTLVILIAPPAVAFLSWVNMVDGVDAFARVLLNIGYVFTAVVLTQLPRILKLDFALSFWALSFPFAAITIASFVYSDRADAPAFALIGTVLLIGLGVIVAGLSIRTIKAVLAGKICQPE